MTTFAAGAVFALVIGGGSAVAATGGQFLLGRSNTATTTSTLTNSRGAALALRSKAGTPSLTVNTATRVPHLNSDTLDGLNSTQFARAGGHTGSLDGESFFIDGPDANTTADDAILSYAVCPPGTQMTGGGVSDNTVTGRIVNSAPDTPSSDGTPATEGWVGVVTVDPAANESVDDFYATVVCYNPVGTVAQSYGFAARSRSGATGAVTAKDLAKARALASRTH